MQRRIWGLARSNMRAAEASLRSTQYAQEVVGLTVTSAVAINFLDVLAIWERLAIARRNLETARRILVAIERRATNGLSSPLDLAQQQALVRVFCCNFRSEAAGKTPRATMNWQIVCNR